MTEIQVTRPCASLQTGLPIILEVLEAGPGVFSPDDGLHDVSPGFLFGRGDTIVHVRAARGPILPHQHPVPLFLPLTPPHLGTGIPLVDPDGGHTTTAGSGNHC